MNRLSCVFRTFLQNVSLAVSICSLATVFSTAYAQNADLSAIKDADQAFYAALNARDIKGMAAAWSDKPYITLMGPRSKTMDVGTDAVRNYWQGAFAYFSEVKVSRSIAQIQSDGKLAWIVGTEHAELQPANGGEALKFDTFVTHVFERDANRWLLVSHHAQMIPK